MRNVWDLLFLAYTDLWFKEETRPSDCAKYYANFLLYVYDFLVIHHDADIAMHEIDHFLKMKSGSNWDPYMYLGAKLKNVVLENGVEAWATSVSKYVQEAVSNS